ncbi:MAG: methyl-accepting chemotaxis protein [Rhodobacterales bacterium]|nr:methyl-accepting chemotaxis protein [Rhodobacterales bacterium]
MRAINNINISVKLPFALVMLSAFALGMMGVFSYLDARDSLISAGKQELSQTVAARATEIEQWKNDVQSGLLFQSQSPSIVGALRSFSGSWKAMDSDVAGTAGPYLRDVYIAQSEFLETERDQLVYPKDKSAYSRNHKKYHGYFRSLAKRSDYGDVYLFDANGNMLYSVYKRDDFALTTMDETSGDNALFQLVTQVLSEAQVETVFSTGFSEYTAAGGALSAFVAVAVTNAGGSISGVLAYRIETGALSQIMARSVGLGDQGQSYVLNSGLQFLTSVKAGGTHLTLAEGDPLLGALDGKRGVALVDRELPSVTAFAPFDFEGNNWIIAAHQPVNYLLGPAIMLRNSMVQKGLGFLVIFVLVGLYLGRNISQPLQDFSRTIGEIRAGNFKVPLAHKGRGDEIGTISTSLDSLRHSLAEAEIAVAESMFKSAAVEASSAALMMTDVDFCITHTNAALRRLVENRQSDLADYFPDVSSAGLIGKHIAGLQGIPDRLSDLDEGDSKGPFLWDISFGQCRMAVKISPIKNVSGVTSGAVIEWDDVTEDRKKTAIIKAIETGQIMAEFSPECILRDANENFAMLCQEMHTSLMSRPLSGWIEMWQPVSDPESATDLDDLLLGGAPVHGHFKVDLAQGDMAIIEGGFSPVMAGNDTVDGYIFIGNDVTAAQKDIEQAQEQRKIIEEAQTEIVDALRVGMKNLSQGNLVSRLESPFSPQYENLRNDFNHAVDKLCEAMAEVSTEISVVKQEAGEISSSTKNMLLRSEDQATSLQETAQSLDRITHNIKASSEGIVEINHAVSEARENARKSGDVVDQAEAAMAAISNSSSEIVKVISVIDEIAFQTNLLALNAGVEAARAGEAGRGFAVVATEVRALAQRCSDAAAEIGALMSLSGKHVSDGVTLVSGTGDALKQIVVSVSEISDRIAEMAISGQEQSKGLNDVNNVVTQIDQVTRKNVDIFLETSASSEGLVDRARSLENTISLFEVDRGKLPANSDPDQHAFSPPDETKMQTHL